ncbi:ribosome maturation factor [Treponema sp. Marseille-Q4523]|uniref:ribosome maturation factor n=1 Tax=Treponema TaxID=157 RepID=UPI00195F5819|nr:ribosome maturation factor [Treponema sp. Marseille-Q4523]MBM7022715.1 ribosome maturation factor [Treponema sp. Marseille-Q4523]
MEYIAFDAVPYYSECAPLVEGLGYHLIELKIVPAKTVTKIFAVIAPKEPDRNISVNDCSRVHHALLPRLEALLGTDNTSMELTSPGIDRNIKNAAEFSLFIGRSLRVWSKKENDWIGGKIVCADEAALTMETEKGEAVTVPYGEIAKAKFVQ